MAVQTISKRLNKAGVRATRQRMIIGDLLWASPEGRHVEAGTLHAAVEETGMRISLATIYNTWRDFEKAGLIRRIAIASERIWYDTDTGDHQHFHIEAENQLLDLPLDWQPEGALPVPPIGYRIKRVDTVIHLERDD